MQKRLVAFSIAAAVIAAAACGSDSTQPAPVSKIVNFTANMTPAGEPGTLNGSPTGSGTFTAALDTSTNVLTWTFAFQGLTSNVNNGHIHGPFPSGTSTAAGVILNFNPASPPPGSSGLTFVGFGAATSGSGGGSITLTSTVIGGGVSGDSLKKLLLSGNVYVNIHTTSNPGGEIRGQITKK